MKRLDWRGPVILIPTFIAGTLINLLARKLLPGLLPASWERAAGLLAALIQIIFSIGILLLAVKKPGGRFFILACFLVMAFMPVCAPVIVFAAGSTKEITASFESIYHIIAAVVTSIGQLYLLWGVFEWAASMNARDGVSQSMAFKRIAAGLLACLAPTIISMIRF